MSDRECAAGLTDDATDIRLNLRYPVSFNLLH